MVKVDQFRTRLLSREISTRSLLKVVGIDTLEAFGRQLVALHEPRHVDWAARFGLPEHAAAPPSGSQAPVAPRLSGVTCASCGVEVSQAEARFCRFNKTRFDGQTYCMPCQQRVAPHTKQGR